MSKLGGVGRGTSTSYFSPYELSKQQQSEAPPVISKQRRHLTEVRSGVKGGTHRKETKDESADAVHEAAVVRLVKECVLEGSRGVSLCGITGARVCKEVSSLYPCFTIEIFLSSSLSLLAKSHLGLAINISKLVCYLDRCLVGSRRLWTGARRRRRGNRDLPPLSAPGRASASSFDHDEPCQYEVDKV